MSSIYDLAKLNAASYSEKLRSFNGWEQYTDSNQLNLSNDGYYGIACINEETKEIVIASKGTDFIFGIPYLNDAYTVYQIFHGEIPNQFTNGALPFAKAVIAKLGDQAPLYHINVTGHSLGAVLAELTTVQLALEGIKTSATTFDSLGSLPLAKQLVNGQLNMLNELEIDIYNNRDNWFNNWHKQSGDVHQIDSGYHAFLPIIGDFNQHKLGNMLPAFDKNTGEANIIAELGRDIVSEECESYIGNVSYLGNISLSFDPVGMHHHYHTTLTY